VTLSDDVHTVSNISGTFVTQMTRSYKSLILLLKLYRQASQEAAELEHLASRRRKSDALNKPKQPKGSFVFFLNEYRARMVKDASLQNKKTNLGQMTKEAGILWRSMDNAKKEPYQNLAAKDSIHSP